VLYHTAMETYLAVYGADGAADGAEEEKSALELTPVPAPGSAPAPAPADLEAADGKAEKVDSRRDDITEHLLTPEELEITLKVRCIIWSL
jgi:hypothetical protein